jgi:transketolase
MTSKEFSKQFLAQCRQTRKDIIEIFLQTGGGHLASALSTVEILVTLYDHKMRRGHDKFLLSKGHGCLALYAVLGRLGYFSKTEWSRLGKAGGLLGGHPTSEIPGVEISTGSLGLAPSVAVGMAAAERLAGSDALIFCLLGDGELNEGSVWEAAFSAAQHQLGNLYFFVDCNGYQAYGKTDDVWSLEPLPAKWKAFNWETHELDLRQDASLLYRTLQTSVSEKPKVFLCRTSKGMGVPQLENNPTWHNKTKLSEQERQVLLEYLNT